MNPDLGLVFDVNVWIDAAIYLDSVGSLPQKGGPVDRDPYLASAMCFTWFLSKTPMGLLLYSDDLILQVTHRKLTQPTVASRPEDQGYEWESITATSRLYTLLQHVDATGRSRKVDPPAKGGAHGVDHEDRRVFGVLEYAASHAPHDFPLMITGDKTFADEINLSGLNGRPDIPKWGAMSPCRFTEMLTKKTRNDIR